MKTSCISSNNIVLKITMYPTCINSVVASLKVFSEPVKGELQRVSSDSVWWFQRRGVDDEMRRCVCVLGLN